MSVVRRDPIHTVPIVARFYRTDQDRKPAKVVQRPNDGPGSMEERERIAAEIRESLMRKSPDPIIVKKIIRQVPKTTKSEIDKQVEKRRMEILKHVQATPGLTVKMMMGVTGYTDSYLTKTYANLHNRGLIRKDVFVNRGVAMVATITDAGIERLREYENGQA